MLRLKDIPGLRQIALLLGIAAAVAAGIAVFMWSQRPGMVPLYADLSDKDASAIADALRTAGIEYRLDDASGEVLVAPSQVHSARLKLASQGLPKSSAMGFEMMQQEQGFGTSQFVESARYQHALETELARSVATLQPVRNARVHLAIPKPSAFTRSGDGPSASVLVELHNGRTLEERQVASIVHMVASSVSGLIPASVTVIDQYGRLMTRSDPNGDVGRTNDNFEHTRRLEADYVRRIEQLLAPMTGPGRVSAQVTADMDFSVTEEAKESFNPDRAVLRSEQTSEDVSRSTRTAQGIPGATSNQPPDAKPQAPLIADAQAPAPSGDAGEQSRRATRSYEIDRTLSHTRQAGGAVKRLSVAVLIDHLPKADGKGGTTLLPLDESQLRQVDALVREAVGFSSERGDTVSVQNVPFIVLEVPAAEAVPIWQRGELRDGARLLLGAAVVIVLILAVVRPVMRNLLNPPAPVNAHPLQAVFEPQRERALDEDRLVLGTAEPAVPAFELKLQAARGAVKQDPKRVAQVVKNWVAEGS